MPDKSQQESCTIPFTISKNEDGTWLVECKFCDKIIGPEKDHVTLETLMLGHAAENHYDWPSDLYMNDENLKRAKEHRAKVREILGSREDVQSLNEFERGFRN